MLFSSRNIAACSAAPWGVVARIHAFAWVFVLGLTLGCDDLPGKPDPSSRPTPPDQVVDFDQLFARHCAGCHGDDGAHGPAPPLNDPILLAIIPADELLLTIAAGRSGTPMPAFSHRSGGPLTDEQVQTLVGGIKPRWKGDAPLGHKPPPYHAPADEQSAADAARGLQVFARACAECHGERGEGGHSAGAIHTPEFLQLTSDRALRRIIITGRPDLGMPHYAEADGRDGDFKPLTSQDVGDLVALLAEWRREGDRPVAPELSQE
jgi:mono/diheme cytochrome c family protein